MTHYIHFLIENCYLYRQCESFFTFPPLSFKYLFTLPFVFLFTQMYTFHTCSFWHKWQETRKSKYRKVARPDCWRFQNSRNVNLKIFLHPLALHSRVHYTIDKESTQTTELWFSLAENLDMHYCDRLLQKSQIRFDPAKELLSKIVSCFTVTNKSTCNYTLKCAIFTIDVWCCYYTAYLWKNTEHYKCTETVLKP